MADFGGKIYKSAAKIASGSLSDLESDIDEEIKNSDSENASEYDRIIEERIKQAEVEGRDKIYEDVSDAQSVMSFQTTMTGMNYINPDADLDDLIDRMLEKEKSNPTRFAELEKER